MKKLITAIALVILLLVPVSCNSRNIDSGGVPPEATLEGEMVLVSGYLRVEYNRTASYLLLWPEGYSWHSEDRQVLINNIDGLTVAGVGDIIAVSGMETTASVAAEYIGEPLDAAAQGPYWLVAKVVARSPKVYISRDEAISIVSEIVPPEVIARAEMMARLMTELGPNGLWQVQFLRANVTRSKLGWQEDDITRFEPDTTSFTAGETEGEVVYPNLIISIDAGTGEILSRSATKSVLLGGPIPERPLYPEYVPREE